MRFATTSLLALPLLAAAAQQESPLDQAKAQAQYWFDKISSYIPSPNLQHPIDAATAKAGGKTLAILTLNDWEDKIRSSVKPASSTPEEWWVLVTGGNKTCFGQCTALETAFNESAALFAVNPTAPHMAYLNCDNQPVLCNSWGAGPPKLWILEVPASPAPVDIHQYPLNTTTTTVKTFTDLRTSQDWKANPLYEGYFHPFDGPIAKYGLAQPLGYLFWAFAIIPSWLLMIGISFISRTLMGGRTGAARRQAPATDTPAAAAAPRAR